MALRLPRSDLPSLTIAGRVNEIDVGMRDYLGGDTNHEQVDVGPSAGEGRQVVIIWEVTAAEESSNTDLPDWAEVGALWYNPETKKLRLLVEGNPLLLSSWVTLITVP